MKELCLFLLGLVFVAAWAPVFDFVAVDLDKVKAAAACKNGSCAID